MCVSMIYFACIVELKTVAPVVEKAIEVQCYPKACSTTHIIITLIVSYHSLSPCLLPRVSLLILYVFCHLADRYSGWGFSSAWHQNSTAIPLRSTSTAMCGTAYWTGSRRRPRWPWPPAILCRAATQTVRRRRSTANPPSKLPRSVDDIYFVHEAQSCD